jgi:hypothetical protein
MCAWASLAADYGKARPIGWTRRPTRSTVYSLPPPTRPRRTRWPASGVSWPATAAAAGMRSPTGTALEQLFGVVGEGLRRGQIQVDVAVFAPDEPGPRAGCCLSVKPNGKGHEPWPSRAAAPGPRPARRERVRHEADETYLLQRARFDPELADRAAGDPLIRLVGLEGSMPDGMVRYPRRLGSPRRLAACRFPRWHGVKGRHTATFV